MSDYNLKITTRNGRILRLMREAGYETQAALAKACATSHVAVNAIVTMRHKPRLATGEWSEVVLRMAGDNPEPVTHTHESLPVGLWQKYASPVWMDVNQSRTLQYRGGRDSDDERHICPLQLDVIERCIDLWSNPGDIVFSPFAGIGSEVFVAAEMGRKGAGAELKPSYFKQAVKNMARIGQKTGGMFDEGDDLPAEVEAA